MTPEQDDLLRRIYNLHRFAVGNVSQGDQSWLLAGFPQPRTAGFGATGTLDTLIRDVLNRVTDMNNRLAALESKIK